jgi:acyl-CoA synthetase (AMP-forming)/AMP-acid ligase II
MPNSLELALQPHPERLTWPAFLVEVAERFGDRIALRQQSMPGENWHEMSYSELLDASRGLARGLIGAGVVKGARVGVLMTNGPDWVVASFAISWVGAVLVPINTFATPEERDYILRHSDTSLLLLEGGINQRDFLEELRSRHVEIGEGVPGRLRCPALPQLRRIVCRDSECQRGAIETWSALLELGEDVDDELLDAAVAEVCPADDGILIYTSGTTAQPKGVLHMQRAAVIQGWRFAEHMLLSPEDIVLTAQPFFWTAGIAMSLAATLAVGAVLILERVFSPERYLDLIESEGVTTLHAWPHQEKAMADAPVVGERNLDSLEKLGFDSPLAKWAGLEGDRWGTSGSYGLSETFTLASSIPADSPESQRRETSGVCLPGMRLQIVDPETGEPCESEGEKGEIAVKGATFMRGYLKVEPEFYLDSNGYFRTGDGGSIDREGFLHWTGRLSNVIKTGGANVSPLEIEGAVAKRDGLRMVSAQGIPHPLLGEIIVLCAVLEKGTTLEESVLLQELKGRLAAYKLPKRVLFFTPDEIRFTANQKLQPESLRAQVLARLEAEGAEIAGARYGS